jgi:hypothetical protein
MGHLSEIENLGARPWPGAERPAKSRALGKSPTTAASPPRLRAVS